MLQRATLISKSRLIHQAAFLICCALHRFPLAVSFRHLGQARLLLNYPPSHRSVPMSGEANQERNDAKILTSQPPRPNDNTYWVTNNLIAGEYPTDKRGEEETRNKIRCYLDLGVDFFVDLTQEGEKESYQRILKQESTKVNLKARHRRLPIQDFGTPTTEEMQMILDTIDSAIADNRKVYVHCRGGIGRTGTTVGCYLARHGYGGEEALAEVNKLFQNSNRSFESSCSPETKAQMTMIQEWDE